MNPAIGASGGKLQGLCETTGLPLAVLAALLSRPLLLAPTARALPGLGVGLRPGRPFRAGAPAGRGCAWLPQLEAKTAGLSKASSSVMA